MTITARVQVAAPPERVYAALTDPAQLESWLAEHTDVSLDENRYEFWGPSVPGLDQGRQRLLTAVPGELLRFSWRWTDDTHRTVEVRLTPEDTGTIVTIAEADDDGKPVHEAGFWFLALANLVGYLAGHSPGVRHDHRPEARAIEAASCETDIDVPPEDVFAALMTPQTLSRWMMATDATVEPEVGGTYDIGWDHGPMKILELEPGRVLAYSWRYPDCVDTVVRWELEGSEGRTHLTVVHSGFDDPDIAEQFRDGWPGFLVNLKRLLELGVDRRRIEVWFGADADPWTG